ncbi:hypothetical protein [Clostridium sp. JNZ J1-5]
MSKISGKRILIFIILIFVILNISWFSIISIKYTKFLKAVPKNRGGIHGVLKDGYAYNVKKPDYLHYTGNLGISNTKTGELLIIWPKIFGGYKYGFRLKEGKSVYELYVDENINPIDKDNKDFVKKVKEHKAGIDELFSKANEMWKLK